MKILVYGAGVLGCNLARNLLRAGKDVTLLARGNWAAEIKQNGLRIKDKFSPRTSVSRIPVVTELAPDAKYDVILGPVAPTTAPKLGSSLADPIKMYLGDIYTISINLAGLPGISVPCGTDSQGLPIGMQLIGDCFKEKTLIRAAYTYEQRR